MNQLVLFCVSFIFFFSFIIIYNNVEYSVKNTEVSKAVYFRGRIFKKDDNRVFYHRYILLSQVYEYDVTLPTTDTASSEYYVKLDYIFEMIGGDSHSQTLIHPNNRFWSYNQARSFLESIIRQNQSGETIYYDRKNPASNSLYSQTTSNYYGFGLFMVLVLSTLFLLT